MFEYARARCITARGASFCSPGQAARPLKVSVANRVDILQRNNSVIRWDVEIDDLAPPPPAGRPAGRQTLNAQKSGKACPSGRQFRVFMRARSPDFVWAAMS